MGFHRGFTIKPIINNKIPTYPEDASIPGTTLKYPAHYPGFTAGERRVNVPAPGQMSPHECQLLPHILDTLEKSPRTSSTPMVHLILSKHRNPGRNPCTDSHQVSASAVSTRLTSGRLVQPLLNPKICTETEEKQSSLPDF